MDRHSSCILPFLNKKVKRVSEAPQKNKKKNKNKKAQSSMDSQQMDSLKSNFDSLMRELNNQTEVAKRYKRKSVDLSHQLKYVETEKTSLQQKLSTWNPSKEAFEILKNKFAQAKIQLKACLMDNSEKIQKNDLIIKELVSKSKVLEEQCEDEKSMFFLRYELKTAHKKIGKFHNKIQHLSSCIENMQKEIEDQDDLIERYRLSVRLLCKKYRNSQLVNKFIRLVKKENIIQLKDHQNYLLYKQELISEKNSSMEQEILSLSKENHLMKDRISVSVHKIQSLEQLVKEENDKLCPIDTDARKIIQEKGKHKGDDKDSDDCQEDNSNEIEGVKPMEYSQIEEGLNQYFEQVQYLQEMLKDLKQENSELFSRNKKLKDRYKYYKNLYVRPTHKKEPAGSSIIKVEKERNKTLFHPRSTVHVEQQPAINKEKESQGENNTVKREIYKKKNFHIKFEEEKGDDEEYQNFKKKKAKVFDRFQSILNKLDKKNNKIEALIEEKQTLKALLETEKEVNREHLSSIQTAKQAFVDNLNAFKRVENTIICPACQNVLQSPCMLDECFHIFCQKCIRETCFICLNYTESCTNLDFYDKICQGILEYKQRLKNINF